MSLTNAQKGQAFQFRKDPAVAVAANQALATIREYAELKNSSTLGVIGRAIEMGATTEQDAVSKLLAITADFNDRIAADKAVRDHNRMSSRPDEIY